MNDELAARYGWRNPRSAEEPMAFTFREFTRGALTAWGWFLAASAVILPSTGMIPVLVMGPSPGWGESQPLTMALLYLWFGAPVVIAVSLAALLVWSPLAYLIARSLRRVVRFRTHLVVYIAFGIVAGFGTALICSVPIGFPALGILAAFAVAASVAVPYGWSRAVRRAIGPDVENGASVSSRRERPED